MAPFFSVLCASIFFPATKKLVIKTSGELKLPSILGKRCLLPAPVEANSREFIRLKKLLKISPYYHHTGQD